MINNTAIFADRFYQANIRGQNVVVPGRYFRARQGRPGAFSVKVNKQRVKVPMNIAVSEVSFNFNAQASAAPAGAGLVAVPASGAVPRGFNVVTQIGGQQVTVNRKHMRASNTRPGHMVVKYGNTTHLVPAASVMMASCG